MRQLITRIDEKLHRKLKARAAAQGRSVNSLVTELLEEGLGRKDRAAVLRSRAEARGLLVIPPMERRAPSLDAVVRMTRGAGRSASEALTADREAR